MLVGQDVCAKKAVGPLIREHGHRWLLIASFGADKDALREKVKQVSQMRAVLIAFEFLPEYMRLGLYFSVVL